MLKVALASLSLLAASLSRYAYPDKPPLNADVSDAPTLEWPLRGNEGGQSR
jgi:hypothetical protein